MLVSETIPYKRVTAIYSAWHKTSISDSGIDLVLTEYSGVS